MTLSKYNEIMSRVRVDDNMKERILGNLEKELEKENGNNEKVSHRNNGNLSFYRFRKQAAGYAAIAASFVVLFIGTYAVLNNGGFEQNTATLETATETATETAGNSAVMDEDAQGMLGAYEESAAEESAAEEFEAEEFEAEESEVEEIEAANAEPAEPAETELKDEEVIESPETEAEVITEQASDTTQNLLLSALISAVIIMIVLAVIRFIRKRQK